MLENSFQGQDVDTTPASDVFLVIGIPGSGKTSVAGALARRFPLGAHIEGDLIGEFIVSGKRLVSPEEDREADRQSLLRARNAAALARSFRDGGVVPVIDDVVVRRAHLDFYLEHLTGLPVRLIVLAPTPEAAGARIAARDKKLADDWSFLDEALREELTNAGTWIDSTNLSLSDTVDRILADE